MKIKLSLLKYRYAVLGVVLAAMISSCDTSVEAVDINEPTIETQNPELYNAYLQNLTAYKGRDHKMVFGWFDNSVKTAVSQAQVISAVPDSLDFLVLSDPNLNENETKEVADLLSKKMIRSLFEVNCDTLSSADIQSRLAYSGNFAGVVFTFSPVSKIYYTDEEKATAQAAEQAFVSTVTTWKNQNASKLVVIKGMPQNLDDKSVLSVADYIIIPCEDVASAGEVIVKLNKACVTDVPTTKFVPMVSLYSLDSTDSSTGYWGDTYAALGIAEVAAADYAAYTIAGIALDNISNDYYHANFIYPTVREAISIVNPTVRK